MTEEKTKNNSPEDLIKPNESNPFNIEPKELERIKKRLEEIKDKAEKFQKDVLKKFSEYILGIAILPPEKKGQKEVNIFVLVDDSDSKKMSKEELSEKLGAIIAKSAEDIDKDLKAQTMLLSELKESCFDAKYEVLDMIARSTLMYDKGILSALKVAEIHKRMTIEKFEKYILSYVAVGSLFRGDSNPSDIDVYLVVDDTDVKRMSRFELRDKLSAIIRDLGSQASQLVGIKASFHIQTYILTDFWDSVKDAHPVIFTFLRDGVPLYDKGVFMPWKLLLKMGRIKPSPEAIDMQMSVGEYKLNVAKGKLLSVIGEDLYYAMLNPAQAALMLYGIPPTTPKETVHMMEEVFVKKEKLLDKKYVDILEKIRKYYKEIEHETLKEVTGKEIDDLLKDAKEYLEAVKKLFEKIEKRKEKEDLEEIYTVCVSVTKDALNIVKEKSSDSNLVNTFKKKLVDTGKLPEKMIKTLKMVMKIKENKLAKQEIEKVKKEVRSYVKMITEFIQISRGIELERARIRIKIGDKFGEVLLLDDIAFIITDEKKVSKAKLLSDGGLGEMKESSLEEMDKCLAEVKVIPERVFIKEKIFEGLKRIFGKDIEILINY